MVRRRLPIGMQTFRKIRELDCYYVDKTPYVRRLLDGGTHYFLSRPRRFGKSLFLDTCKELFEGSECLFEGLAIHASWDWSKRHPVVRLDFGSGHFNEPGYLHKDVMAQLDGVESEWNLTSEYDTGPARLRQLLGALHARTGERVAVLVDEYDKPILDALDSPDVARANRDYLRGLYSVVKTCDASIRFTFLTGVSKFSKVSLFSGLNNLIDLTLDPRYAALCGYTDEDVDTVFAPELPGLDREAIRDWYDGYHWRGEARVYNPFDVLALFDRREFDAYWFETGTPAFLVETLFRRRVASISLEGMLGGNELLSAFDVDHIGTEALLFQTGYLTIKAEGRSWWRAPVPAGLPEPRGAPEPEPELVASSRAGCDATDREQRAAVSADGGQRRGPDWRTCFTPSSRAFPTSGTRTTTLPASRVTTRACSTPILRQRGSTSGWRTVTATAAWTWRCSLPATCTCSSSKSGSGPERARALAQSQDRGYADKYRAPGRSIHLVGVEFSREARNVSGFEAVRID